MRRKLFAALLAPFGFYMSAALMMTISYVGFGVPVEGHRPMIGGLRDGMPAERAGLHIRDEIVAIDGHAITDPSQVAPAINAGGEHVPVEVVRAGERRTFTVTPVRDGDNRRIGIEIWPIEEFQRAPFFTGLGQALLFPARYAVYVLRFVFSGRAKAEFSGPIGIIKTIRHQVSWPDRLGVLAVYSVYFMLFSLLIAPLIFWRAAASRPEGGEVLRRARGEPDARI
jgi:membrane-associated protease RseP (regulator of RpoE activity)